MKRTSSFTLLITASTAGADQDGPARIVSLSADVAQRNVTLGQSGSALVVRLRTPFTGGNGGNPELVVPDVFNTSVNRHVIVTYDGLDLLVYVDGRRRPEGMRLGVGPAAFAPVFGRRPTAFYTYHVIYYVILFVPLGVLLSLYGTSAPSRKRLPVSPLALSPVLLFGFEAALLLTTHGIFSASRMASNLAFAGTGTAVGVIAGLRVRARVLSNISKRAQSGCCRKRLP